MRRVYRESPTNFAIPGPRAARESNRACDRCKADAYNPRMHVEANDFPIAPLLPAIRDSLRAHPRLVLEAPPGAGKTTQVPPALLDEPWLQGRKIILLEPRRIAARAAAEFMARQFGESVGQTVGYRIRFESRVSAQTRIEVVTEGILTRMLQDDPELPGVGAILFDEFQIGRASCRGRVWCSVA